MSATRTRSEGRVVGAVTGYRPTASRPTLGRPTAWTIETRTDAGTSAAGALERAKKIDAHLSRDICQA